jgi:hypothetical protein
METTMRFEEVMAIFNTIQICMCISGIRPKPEDENIYHSVGYVDTALIKSVVTPQLENVRLYGCRVLLMWFSIFPTVLKEGLRNGESGK